MSQTTQQTVARLIRVEILVDLDHCTRASAAHALLTAAKKVAAEPHVRVETRGAGEALLQEVIDKAKPEITAL